MTLNERIGFIIERSKEGWTDDQIKKALDELDAIEEKTNEA